MKNHGVVSYRFYYVIRQLCVLLNCKDIYLTLAQILLEEENLKFASIMVETLNTILLTSSELFELRTQLKDLKNEVIFALSVNLIVLSLVVDFLSLGKICLIIIRGHTTKIHF